MIIIFMIFRLFYYIRLISQSSLINNNRIIYDKYDNGGVYDNIFDNKLNNKYHNLFGLNFELNNENGHIEKEELKNSNFDIKKIFKDLDLEKFNKGFDLGNINLENFKLEDFNLEKILNISSLMKENKNSVNNEESNNIKCKCHLCNNCMNKKNI